MAERGCLKDGHFQNLEGEGNSILKDTTCTVDSPFRGSAKLLVDIDSFHTKKIPHYWPELSETAKQLQNQLPEKMSLFEVERALIEDSNIFTNTERFKLINNYRANKRFCYLCIKCWKIISIFLQY